MVAIPFLAEIMCPELPPAIINGGNDVLTTEQAEALLQLTKAGVVISPEELISEIVSFYSTMIQILLAILTVIGIVAFLSLRSLSRDQAEKVAESAISNHVEKQKFHKDVADIVMKATDPYLQQVKNKLEEISSKQLQIDDIDEIMDEIARIQTSVKELGAQIVTVSSVISKLDDSEELVENVKIED
jgi:polyhydroxyalkanoate synthesis regulator protein